VATNETESITAITRTPRYHALAEKIGQHRRERSQPNNVTPKLIRTMLEFDDFQCFPTIDPHVYPNSDVLYPCEPLKKIGGNLLREGSFKKVFARGQELYGDIPDCHGICYCFGNVFSSYFVKDFWALAGDTMR